MSLENNLPVLKDYIAEHFADAIGYQRDLNNILEGSLLKYVEDKMRLELNPKAFQRARGRIPAINVLSKVVDKLSALYTESPKRDTENPIDRELMSYYVKEIDLDSQMAFANKLFNTNKYVALEPYVDNRTPQLRVIPAHQFLVYSDNEIDPLKPTVFIKFRTIDGSKYTPIAEKLKNSTFNIYSDKEFLVVDGMGNIRRDLMVGNEDGINPYQVLPFVYISTSSLDLIPMKDSDIMTMATLAPLLFSDLNYAIQYLSHSILYGIDLNISDLEMNPDSFWLLNSQDGENKNPQIGAIKPEVDIDKVLTAIKEQLMLWFETKGLKAAGQGTSQISNASGIAKIIDESDTTEARKKQMKIFQKAESNLWYLISQMHKVWAYTNIIDEKRIFSEDFEVAVEYEDMKPLDNEIEKLNEIKLKLDMGLISKRMAIKMANPDLSEEQLLALEQELVGEEGKAIANIKTMQPEATSSDMSDMEMEEEMGNNSKMSDNMQQDVMQDGQE